MHLITISNLFPNTMQIRHGVFVRERLRHFKKHLPAGTSLTIDVIAPIASFPFGLRASLRPLREVGESERDDLDLEVYHPRYWAVPLIGNLISPLTYAKAILPIVTQLAKRHDKIILDAHFGFPDGVAANLVAKRLNLPVVVTLRGSDVNVMSREFGISSWFKWMLNNSSAVVTVSEALRHKTLTLGCLPDRVSVIRNGVDRDRFKPTDERIQLRRKLNLNRPTILSVGNLLELKGHHLVIEALSKTPDWQLVVIGTGPMHEELKTLADKYQVACRVRFEGNMTQTELAEYYASADVLVLASSREGLPNVVLEANACGLPVIATDVGGVAEIVRTPQQGVVLAERTVNAITTALATIDTAETDIDRVERAGTIADFDWRQTSKSLKSTVFQFTGLITL